MLRITHSDTSRDRKEYLLPIQRNTFWTQGVDMHIAHVENTGEVGVLRK